MRRGMAAGRPVTPKTPQIDWAGLKRRTRQVTPDGLGLQLHARARDGRTVLFVATEAPAGGGGGGGGRGAGGTATIYSIQDNGKRMTRLAAATPRPAAEEGDDRPRGQRGGFRGGISNLRLTRDGRTLYFQEGESVYSTPVGGGGGGGGGGAAAFAALGGGGGAPAGGAAATPPGPRTRPHRVAAAARSGRITFNVTVRIDKPQEWEEMFDDAWRCMKYRFYDPKLHGTDWDAMRAKYKPLVAYVADRQELMNVINEMIGELNASHTGAVRGAGPEHRGGRVRAGLDATPRAGPPGGCRQRPVQGGPRLRGRPGR